MRKIPNLTRFALKHKYAGYVGKGKAAWSVIHVLDLAKVRQAIGLAQCDQTLIFQLGLQNNLERLGEGQPGSGPYQPILLL